MTVAPAEQLLCPGGLEFRLAANGRPPKSFLRDRKVDQ